MKVRGFEEPDFMAGIGSVLSLPETSVLRGNAHRVCRRACQQNESPHCAGYEHSPDPVAEPDDETDGQILLSHFAYFKEISAARSATAVVIVKA